MVKKRRWRERFPRTRGPRDAGDAVAALIDHYKISGSVRGRRVLTGWRELVGEQIARRTWPGPIDDGLLTVWVSSSAWLQELSFQRAMLAERLRRHTGDLVTDVRFALGKPRRGARENLERAERSRRRPVTAPPAPEPIAASGEDLLRITSETDSVDDPELRAIIRATRVRHNR